MRLSTLFSCCVNVCQRCYRGGSRGRVQGVQTSPLPSSPPHHPEMTCGFLVQLVLCKKKTSSVSYPFLSGAPPPKKNSGSTPGLCDHFLLVCYLEMWVGYQCIPCSLECSAKYSHPHWPADRDSVLWLSCSGWKARGRQYFQHIQYIFKILIIDNAVS